MPQDKRILVLPVAAVIILTAVIWRTNNPRPSQSEMELPRDGQAAVFVLGTGLEEDNLRTALWIRRLRDEAYVEYRL